MLADEKTKQSGSLLLLLIFCMAMLLSGVVFIICIAAGVIACDPPELKGIAVGVFSVLTLALAVVWVVILSKYHSRVKLLNSGNVKCIRIEVLEKLPSELASGIGDTNIYIYPVMGKDTTTGYESVCYMDEKEYENAKTGSVISICVYPEELS